VAHCAEIGNDGVVKRVIVVEDYYGDLTCEEWCARTFGGMWKKTSYNTHGGKHNLGGTPFRMNYAGKGFIYDSSRDAFIPQAPYKNWKLDNKTCLWEAPKPYPNDGKKYLWDDKMIDWRLKT